MKVMGLILHSFLVLPCVQMARTSGAHLVFCCYVHPYGIVVPHFSLCPWDASH